MEEYVVSYGVKDLIVYALSLGMGSQSDDSNEIKFLYEEHEKFAGVPTFCFAFTFWAQNRRNTTRATDTTTQGIPAFPPPIMSETEVIPRKFLRNNANISNLPVIHTWQSIVWHRPMEIPNRKSNHGVTSRINQEIISVQPKSIGTFVTSQSKVTAHDGGKLLCTMQSTALVLGLDPKNVIAFDAGIQRLTNDSSKMKQTREKPPLFQWTYQTSQSQAFLYRMASGDSNHIHVDTSASDMLGNDKKAPLLHGLFTLALAFRGIVKLFDGQHGSNPSINFGTVDDYELFFRKLEGSFKSPAFVGDKLCVKIWNDDTVATTMKTSSRNKRFRFVIINPDTGTLFVDNGCADVESIPKSISLAKRSRL
jgi:acyl dehydratase